MKKNLLALSVALLIASKVSAQNDPRAEQILDNFSTKAATAPSVSMDFQMVTNDMAEKRADTLKGSAMICKDMYVLKLGENITWFNGQTTWNYLTAENEVTITSPDKKDQSFQSHPSAIFTMYKSGYKSRLVDESGSVYTVDLYPENIKSDLVRVRLNIRKSDLSLQDFEYRRHDGVVINLYISAYDLKKKPDQSEFTFPSARYKGAEINDMR
jgi:outer membrane lipoprotein-sorting protein